MAGSLALWLGTLAGEAPARKEPDETTGGPVADAGLDGAVAGVWAAYGRMYVRGPEGVPAGPAAAPAHGRMVVDRPGDEGMAAIDAFLRGYDGAGGRAEYRRHLVEDVIPCEYGWGPYVKVNYYESRAQFDPQSWRTAGGGDPADDGTVGRNVANWIGLIDDPGSSSGWPVCWKRGGW